MFFMARLCASDGHTVEAANTFEKIREIITNTVSNCSFKSVIHEIAGISDSAFRNYISGKQKGRISNYTVEKFAKFSNIPEGVFAGIIPFDANYQAKFSEALRSKFNKEKENITTATDVAALLDTFAELIANKVVSKLLEQNKKEI